MKRGTCGLLLLAVGYESKYLYTTVLMTEQRNDSTQVHVDEPSILTWLILRKVDEMLLQKHRNIQVLWKSVHFQKLLTIKSYVPRKGKGFSWILPYPCLSWSLTPTIQKCIWFKFCEFLLQVIRHTHFYFRTHCLCHSKRRKVHWSFPLAVKLSCPLTCKTA